MFLPSHVGKIIPLIKSYGCIDMFAGLLYSFIHCLVSSSINLLNFRQPLMLVNGLRMSAMSEKEVLQKC
jgi:hypothetical protein